MASLNDIENKIDTIINDLFQVGIGNVKIIPLILSGGVFKLDGYNFNDIRQMVSDGIMPYLGYIDDTHINYYVPSLYSADTDGLTWYYYRYRPSTQDMRINVLVANETGDNSTFTQHTRTITTT